MTQPPGGSADAQQIFQQAKDAADRGEFEQAAALNSRLVGNPDPTYHVAGLLGLADARYRLDDEAGALQAWISATQAPETPLTWRAWKALAAARVRSGDLTGAARAYREAERRAPPNEQAEIASRIGWLSKELGDSSASRRAFGRSRTSYAPQPVVTWALLAATIGIGV